MEVRQFKDLPLDSYFIFKGEIPVPHKAKAPIVFIKKTKTIIRQFGQKEEIKFLKKSYLCDFLGQNIEDIAPDYFINSV